MKWTRRLDVALVEALWREPGGAIPRFAKEHGIGIREVTRHLQAIGITVVAGPRRRRCHHGTPLMQATVCADCAEERAVCR